MSLESRASQRNYSRSEKPPLPAKPSRTSSRASLASNQSRASTASRASIASSIHSAGAGHQDTLNRSTRSRASVASGGSDQLLNQSINSQMSNTNSAQGQNQTNESNTNAVLEEPVSVISDETIEDGYVISQDQALDDTIQSEKDTEKIDDPPIPGMNGRFQTLFLKKVKFWNFKNLCPSCDSASKTSPVLKI